MSAARKGDRLICADVSKSQQILIFPTRLGQKRTDFPWGTEKPSCEIAFGGKLRRRRKAIPPRTLHVRFPMQQNRINSLEFGPYEMIDDPVAYENHVHVPQSAVRISLNIADFPFLG